VRGVEERTPKGGYSMGERPQKPAVLLHCTTCEGEFPVSRLRLIKKTDVFPPTYDMVCPECDPQMRRAYQ
jgi:hypothetical protein